MNKLKCPKCRNILFRYKSELGVSDGKFIMNMKCPCCKAIVEINVGPECENYVKKVKDESELEL